MSERRFLVIGRNSFTGSHFVRHLLDQGLEVVGVSRSDEPAVVFLPYRWGPCDGFRFHRIDLNHDLDHLMEVIEAQRTTHVVNFAAQGMVAQSWEHPDHWYMTNVVAQARLHERLRRLDHLEKYVHVSTPEVYGTTDEWMTESTDFAPSTPYAVSRAACDLHLLALHEAYGYPVVFTRAANVYGPGQQLYRIVPKTMLFARTGRRLQLHGGGTSSRSFIHISDVADATRRVALVGDPGQTYHVSTQSAVTVRALVERICTMTGTPFGELVEVVGERLGKDQAYLLDTVRLRRDLDWSDSIGLDDGLAATLCWVDDNLGRLRDMPTDYVHQP